MKTITTNIVIRFGVDLLVDAGLGVRMTSFQYGIVVEDCLTTAVVFKTNLLAK